MSKWAKVVMAAVVCIWAAAMNHRVDGANNCNTVLNDLMPCRTYLQQGGSTVPGSCCDGLKSLNAAATTTELRRSYCQCLVSEGKSYGISEKAASNLVAKCNIKLNYPISYNINCTSIH